MFFEIYLQFSDSSKFQDTTVAQRNLLFHYINAVAAASEEAMVEGGTSQRLRSFKYWSAFLISIGISSDKFLERYDRFTKNILVCAFAEAIREASFTLTNKKLLVEGTVVTTISYLAQTFMAKDRGDPKLDKGGEKCFLLREKLRGYRNQDGSKKKQKLLPMLVLRRIDFLANTTYQKAVSKLLIGAIFFAMRSCEYLQTRLCEEQQRTKTLQIRNIRFVKNGVSIPHSAKNLGNADMVLITFKKQKNNKQDKNIFMYATKDTFSTHFK